jgi:small redox-active disulfide protein 2
MIIKILGKGCPNCQKLEENTRLALSELHIEAEIIKVIDIKEISRYGVMGLPALVFDEKVVSYGKVLNKPQVMALLSPGNLSSIIR